MIILPFSTQLREFYLETSMSPSNERDDDSSSDDARDGYPSDLHIIDSSDDDNEEHNIARLLERVVIGYDADRALMERYAEILVNIKCLSSVEIIKEYCQDQDVDGWDWMKPMHRKAFKKWLLQTKAAN